MSVTELHPEDLLDREARGDLAPKERAMLDAHLAHCAACRLEREVRADFADEMAADGPVHDGSLLVSRVLEKTEPPPGPLRSSMGAPAPVSAPPSPRTATRPRRQLRVAILVAAALMLAGVAGARVTGVWSILAPESASTPVTTRPAELPISKAPIAPAAAMPHDAPLPTMAASDPDPGPDAPRATAAIAPRAAAAVPAPRARPPVLATTAAAASPASVTPAIAPAIVVTAPALGGEDPTGAPALFADATSARRRGKHTRATTLYRDLLARHPDAAEASAARVALGRLLLDEGDAAGALPLFETYLRSGDPALREEAMAARARSQGRLGRSAEESAAWSALLQSYPQSIHAARARARLEELGHR